MVGGLRLGCRADRLQWADPQLLVWRVSQADHGRYGLGPRHGLVCDLVWRALYLRDGAVPRLGDGPLEHPPGRAAGYRDLRLFPDAAVLHAAFAADFHRDVLVC